MVEPAFSHLRRKLLEGGIAPRRVDRVLQELRDHYACLLVEQQGTGLVGAAAAEAALAHLGTEESLARQLLARPELLAGAAAGHGPYTVLRRDSSLLWR